MIEPKTIKSQKTTTIQSIDHFAKQIEKVNLYKTQLDLKKIDINIKNKSLLVIIGDFLQVPNLTTLSKKHELFIIIIRDSFEENPTVLGEVEVEDPSTGKTSKFNFDKYAKDSYKQRYIENDEKLYKYFKSIKASYLKIVTDEDAYKKLYL